MFLSRWRIPFNSGKAFTEQTMDLDTGRSETCVWHGVFAHFPTICVIDVTVRVVLIMKRFLCGGGLGHSGLWKYIVYL